MSGDEFGYHPRKTEEESRGMRLSPKSLFSFVVVMFPAGTAPTAQNAS